MDTILEKVIDDPLNLVSYIETIYNSKWYLLPYDYWIMNHWGQFGISENLNHKDQEHLFLKKIEEFQISQDILLNSVKENIKLDYLIPTGLIEPKVYANFTKKSITATGEFEII